MADLRDFYEVEVAFESLQAQVQSLQEELTRLREEMQKPRERVAENPREDVTGEGPLSELLAYCVKKAEWYEARARLRRDSAYEDVRKRAAGPEISAAHWRRWEEALRRKMEEEP